MSEFILRGPLGSYPDSKDSFGQQLLKSLIKGGSNVAMIDSITEKEITYADIRVRTLSLANCYKNNFGICKNDVLSICSENNLDFFIPAIAAFYLGVIVAPINYSYIPREIIHAFNISKPKLVICSAKYLDNILEASLDVPSIRKILVFGKDIEELPYGVEYLDDILNDSVYLENFQISTLEPDHVATIMCSSGTTGMPKGVMLTHKNLIVCTSHLGDSEFGHLSSKDVAMALLPFFHAYGFSLHLSHIIINVKMIVIPRFKEELFLSSIEKYKISSLYLVPPLVIFLAKHPSVDKYDLSSLEYITCGAAPLHKDVQNIVRKRLNLINIRQGYGMTETTLAVMMQPLDSYKAGTSGVLVPDMSAKVVDLDTGRSLGPFHEGELCFRGPLVMKKYCGDIQATAAIIDEDGWLHSGDLGYYDKQGFFFIVDRLKELIKYKGFQVPPAELEAILVKNPKILDAAVIGIPDEVSGELPMAFIVKSNEDITEQEIIKYVEDNVSYQKRLRGGVVFISEIPKSSSGKILRRILRDTATRISKL